MATPSAPNRRGATSLAVEPISEQLYSILCERITSGDYAPGSRLDPQSIAKEFGVSRTPVRDTLVRLEHDRLVETRPRSGTFVTRPSRQDVHEVCQLRKGLEWLATGVAAAEMPLEQIADLRDEAVSALRSAEQGDYEPFFASDTRIHNEITASTGNSRIDHRPRVGRALRPLAARPGRHRPAPARGIHPAAPGNPGRHGGP